MSKTKVKRGSSKAERRRAERRRALRRQLGWGLVGAAAVAALVVFALTSPDGGGRGPASSTEVTVDGGPRPAMLLPGEAIPDYSAPALFGETRVAWSDYAGHPTVLSVWASWCPHCQNELPVLARVAADYPGVRLTSIVTAIGQSPGPSPEEFMRDEGLTFPVAVDDGDSTLMRALGVQAFPATYFVDASGTVLRATEGETPEDQLRALFAAVAATA